MNAPKSITLITIVITFTSTVNGFYHKNIPQNEALKNKKVIADTATKKEIFQ